MRTSTAVDSFVDSILASEFWGSEYSPSNGATLGGALVWVILCPRFAGAELLATDDCYRRLDWRWCNNGNTQPIRSDIHGAWRRPVSFQTITPTTARRSTLLVGNGCARSTPSIRGLGRFERRCNVCRNGVAQGGSHFHSAECPIGYFNVPISASAWIWITGAFLDQRDEDSSAILAHHAADRQTYAKVSGGLNASDGPDGYVAYGIWGSDDGTCRQPVRSVRSLLHRMWPFPPLVLFTKTKALWGNYGFATL